MTELSSYSTPEGGGGGRGEKKTFSFSCLGSLALLRTGTGAEEKTVLRRKGGRREGRRRGSSTPRSRGTVVLFSKKGERKEMKKKR